LNCHEMEGELVAALVLGGLVLFFVSWAFGWWMPAQESTAQIPRGSFGWPLIGETLSFANADPSEFVAPRVEK
jgi:hypothetical protein